MAASAAFQHRGSSDRLLDSSNGPGPPSSSSLTLSMNMEAIKDSSIGGMDQHPTPRTIATNKRHAMYALSSMTLLTLQGTVLSIVLRYSRIKEGRKYIPSVAVFISETIKLAICVGVQLFARPENPPSSPSLDPRGPILSHSSRKYYTTLFWQALPMALPATMFAFQQVLLIAAATYLDAVTYQIFNQAFKLIPTAIFAQWLLGQRLTPMQWASIPVLAAGVILVTVNNGPSTDSAAVKAVSQANWLIGMVSCCISGLSSAFAGVYFEKYVKKSNSPNLWIRNIQLSVFGVPFSGSLAVLKDGAAIREYGWLQGFSASTWTVVALQVFGGLVTGMVVKYCDNVIKNFAIAVSVILTVLIAIPLFGQYPSMFFLAGVGLVLVSVFMYGKNLDLDFAKVKRWLWQRRRPGVLIVIGSLMIFMALGGSFNLVQWHSEQSHLHISAGTAINNET